jgi:uncharacterized protein YodC (DUF2158 family)
MNEVVRLKSGGAAMTIEDIDEDKAQARCVWLSGTNVTKQTDQFTLSSLTLAVEAQKKTSYTKSWTRRRRVRTLWLKNSSLASVLKTNKFRAGGTGGG